MRGKSRQAGPDCPVCACRPVPARKRSRSGAVLEWHPICVKCIARVPAEDRRVLREALTPRTVNRRLNIELAEERVQNAALEHLPEDTQDW